MSLPFSRDCPMAMVGSGYFPIANALANLLGRALRGFNAGILTYRTRVPETTIFGALKADPNSVVATDNGLAPNLLPPAITGLARNKSVGELIEELSRNVTLSLFSAEEILVLNDTKATVNTTTNVNIYSYNRQNLILTYVITFVLALIGVVIGGVTYYRNGVSYQNSFSSVMLTTRNPSLDRLTTGHRMGAMPLSDALKNKELKFGLLVDENGEIAGSEDARRFNKHCDHSIKRGRFSWIKLELGYPEFDHRPMQASGDMLCKYDADAFEVQQGQNLKQAFSWENAVADFGKDEVYILYLD
ncbi:hypothetical protein BGZ63DRAFT_408815 [Mariannaea sp. PMI_226]|nr:hypothetical protein BGZ63DRAFT_408815 [Mariannaea sp. PMI_226]